MLQDLIQSHAWMGMEGNPERILRNGLKKSGYYFRQQGVKTK